MNKHISICIVDDNPMITELLTDHFQFSNIDCDITSFNNPDRAISYLDEHKDIDVLITDFHLGGKTGKDIIEHTQSQKTLKILISGHISENELSQFDLSNINFFDKPLKMKELDNTIIQYSFAG